MSKIYFESPFAIYIHVPFCLKKCSYCDFYSDIYNKEKKVKYIDTLKKELKFYAYKIKYRKIRTIYFGGGTPGLLTPAETAEILKSIQNYFSVEKDIEITLEANPYSLSENKIKGYYQCGINRLRLGVQSFNDKELELLGRLHNSKEALQAVKKTGQVFDNLNIDLIFALPGQKCKDWLYTLNQAIKLLPHHISTYNLEIHEDTPLGRKIENGELEKISEEIDARMYKLAGEHLAEAGYRQYEISSFAQTGYEAEHNKIYWQFAPYLGLGPAAHSFDGDNRFYNYADIDKYIKMLSTGELPIQNLTSLKEEELMMEMVIMGLRLTTGLNKKSFENRFAISLKDVYREEIEKLVQAGLLIDNEGSVFLSDKGLLLANQVFIEFLQD